MPANLTQQYLNADARYRAATTDEEKLDALQEMLREIPKHKGTDHMQADIKRKISQLKKQAGKKSATGVRRKNEFHVSKEGAGQVVIVGPPNSGKSALAGALSTAEPEVADYPFTTHRPQPCMGLFENVQIQLVDTAPIAEDYLEPWLPGLVRNADLVSLVLDLSSDDLLDHYEICLRRLEESKLALIADPAQRFGEEGVANKKTHLVGAKSDAPNAADNLEILTEIVDGRFEIIPVSIHRRETLDALDAPAVRLARNHSGLRQAARQGRVEGRPGHPARRGDGRGLRADHSQGFRREDEVRQDLGRGEIRRPDGQSGLRAQRRGCRRNAYVIAPYLYATTLTFRAAAPMPDFIS